MTTTESIATEQEPFVRLCKEAVKDFLQTIVVIDDNPLSPSNETEDASAPTKTAVRSTVGGLPSAGKAPNAPEDKEGDPGEGPKSDTNATPQADQKRHQFDFRKVTKSFSEHELICGGYYPDSTDTRVTISENAFNIAKNADVLVIDWQLVKTGPNPAEPTKTAIKNLLSHDKEGEGRLRLIIIYTGEDLPGLPGELKGAIEEADLDEALSIEEEEVAIKIGKNTRIKFVSKPTNNDATDPVDWDQLPDLVIDEFSKLSKGLLRNFALHATASIRSKVHQTLAVFDPELDGAFLAHKAISPDPVEAEAYIVEILSSTVEDIAIQSNSKNKSLSAGTCQVWMNQNEQNREIATRLKPKEPASLTNKVDFTDSQNPTKIKATVLSNAFLLENGINSKIFEKPSAEQSIPIIQSFYEDDLKTKKANHRLSEISLFTSREKDKNKNTRDVFLTSGTILRTESDNADHFYLCIQPRCDAVRLDPEKLWTFPFARLEVVDTKGDFSIVDGDSITELKLLAKPNSGLVIIQFKPHQELQYVVPSDDSDKLMFKDNNNNTYQWIGELRPMHAQNFITKIVEQLNRVGVTGSEWLRSNQRHSW